MNAGGRRRLEAVCFDLDGTLIDSRPGIEVSLRAALAEVIPERVLGDGELAIGPPLETMLRRLLPEEPAAQDAVAAAFARHYDSDGWRAPTYPGVVAALDALAARGITLHVATNKRSAPTKLILETPPLAGRFDLVVSPDSVAPPHPSKAAALGALVTASGLPPSSVTYVGDTDGDRQAAEAVGCAFLAVGWGYGPLTLGTQSTALRFVETPHDLPAILLSNIDHT